MLRDPPEPSNTRRAVGAAFHFFISHVSIIEKLLSKRVVVKGSPQERGHYVR
jgi:hypothetical protein